MMMAMTTTMLMVMMVEANPLVFPETETLMVCIQVYLLDLIKWTQSEHCLHSKEDTKLKRDCRAE